MLTWDERPSTSLTVGCIGWRSAAVRD